MGPSFRWDDSRWVGTTEFLQGMTPQLIPFASELR